VSKPYHFLQLCFELESPAPDSWLAHELSQAFTYYSAKLAAAAVVAAATATATAAAAGGAGGSTAANVTGSCCRHFD
jgi:hypothetical protein